MHPIAFQFGSLSIHWYGILLAVGFLAGLWTACRRGLLRGLNPERIADVGIWILLGTFIGARGLHVITYWREEFADRPLWEIFYVRQGLVFYGGLIGASLATIIYTRWKRLPLWPMADALAPSIALGQFFGRFGCLMTGCCYGRPTQLPWGICFPVDHATHGQAVHPSQIYEALATLALYLFLAWQFRRKRFEGQTFALYLLLYAGLRFGLEFFRGDYDVLPLGSWATPGQLTSFVVFTAGVLLWRTQRDTLAPPLDGKA